MEPISASTVIPHAAPLTFEVAYVAHRERVYLWAVRFGGGRGAWAEDVTHDVFLKLHAHLHRLDTDDLGAWLYRVTANLSMARLSSERSWLTRLTRVFSGDDAPDTPDDVLRLRGDAADALRLLTTLPPRERVALTMLVLDGRSQREIAQTLDYSEGYVSKLLKRAWARIRAAGWEVDDVP